MSSHLKYNSIWNAAFLLAYRRMKLIPPKNTGIKVVDIWLAPDNDFTSWCKEHKGIHLVKGEIYLDFPLEGFSLSQQREFALGFVDALTNQGFQVEVREKRKDG